MTSDCRRICVPNEQCRSWRVECSPPWHCGERLSVAGARACQVRTGPLCVALLRTVALRSALAWSPWRAALEACLRDRCALCVLCVRESAAGARVAYNTSRSSSGTSFDAMADTKVAALSYEERKKLKAKEKHKKRNTKRKNGTTDSDALDILDVLKAVQVSACHACAHVQRAPLTVCFCSRP